MTFASVLKTSAPAKTVGSEPAKADTPPPVDQASIDQEHDPAEDPKPQEISGFLASE